MTPYPVNTLVHVLVQNFNSYSVSSYSFPLMSVIPILIEEDDVFMDALRYYSNTVCHYDALRYYSNTVCHMMH